MSGERAQPSDEFFVGYAARTPRGVARRVRAATGGLLIGALVLGGMIAWSFGAAGAGTWQEKEEQVTGRIVERPYPMLEIERDGRVERVLLVAPGKHGAGPLVAGWDGRGASFRGTVIARNGRRMVEMSGGAIEERAMAGLKQTPRDIGVRTIAGEIVDSKCHLGAMKPGDGKAHKACAIRCIDGGIPPMLVEADPQAPGGVSYYLLADSGGGAANARVLPFVGEPVKVTGMVEEAGGLKILRILEGAGAIAGR